MLDGLTFGEGWTYRKLQNMDPSLLGALMDRDWLRDEISPVEDLFVSNMHSMASMASMGGNLPSMIETVLRMPFTESIDRSDANLSNMLGALLRHADDEESQKLHLELFQTLISEPNMPDGMITDSDTLRITYQIAVFLVDSIYGRPAEIPTDVAIILDTADLPISGPTDVGVASQEPKASLQRRMEDLKTILVKLDAVLHGLPSDEPITVIIAEDFTFGGSTHIPVEPSWDEVQLLDRIARQYWEGARLHTSGGD